MSLSHMSEQLNTTPPMSPALDSYSHLCHSALGRSDEAVGPWNNTFQCIAYVNEIIHEIPLPPALLSSVVPMECAH